MNRRTDWHTRYDEAYVVARAKTDACERAAGTASCGCVCSGRYHGKKHPPMFVAEYAARLAAQGIDANTDLFTQGENDA
jgi:hypothetical protein